MTATAPIRLTSFSHGAGCACKLSSIDLGKVLAGLPRNARSDILVDAATRDDAARLATVSDGLPLLVTLVGGQLATKAGWTLADHVDLLQQRIQEGRLSTALQAELGLSYAGLGEHSARLLRALADLPLTQVDAEVAEREDPEHHERRDEHRGEDGPADAEFGEHGT